MQQIVALNESGLRMGETHHRAKLTDRDVDLIRELHEEHKLTYRELADKFDASIWAIRAICRYQVRAQVAARWKQLYSEAARKYVEEHAGMTSEEYSKNIPRLLRLPEVLHITGLSRRSIYRRIEQDEFPAPVSLGCNAVGWPEEEVAAWVHSRIKAGRTITPLKSEGNGDDA